MFSLPCRTLFGFELSSRVHSGGVPGGNVGQGAVVSDGDFYAAAAKAAARLADLLAAKGQGPPDLALIAPKRSCHSMYFPMAITL